MTRRIPSREVMLDAVSGTTVSAGYRVSDYRNCILSIGASASTAVGKIFIKGAIGDTAPSNWGSAASRSVSNNWDYVEVVDLEDGSAIDGDTGVDIAGNVFRLLEVNINSLDWLAVHYTVNAAGTVTVKGNFTTNE